MSSHNHIILLLLKITKENFSTNCNDYGRNPALHLGGVSGDYLRLFPLASLLQTVMKKLNGICANKVGGTSGYWQGRILAFLKR